MRTRRCSRRGQCQAQGQATFHRTVVVAPGSYPMLNGRDLHH
jgi:hypothetical protein